MSSNEKNKFPATVAAVKAALINHHHYVECSQGHLTCESGNRRYKFLSACIRVEKLDPDLGFLLLRRMKYSEVYVDQHMRIGEDASSSEKGSTV